MRLGLHSEDTVLSTGSPQAESVLMRALMSAHAAWLVESATGEGRPDGADGPRSSLIVLRLDVSRIVS